MKKVCLCFFILFQQSLCANELEMFSPNFICTELEESAFYKYQYGLSFYLKNISEKELDVISKIGNKKIIKRNDEDYEIYLGLNPVKTINNIPLIPSIVKFELIKLKNGEAASIVYKFKSKIFLPKISLTYDIADFYNDRFGFWNGQVSLQNISLNKSSKCN